VSQQFLHGADVIAGFQKVRGKAVAKEDEFTDPADVGLFGPDAVMANANRRSQLVEQLQLSWYA
jgi:hypothetical protein